MHFSYLGKILMFEYASIHVTCKLHVILESKRLKSNKNTVQTRLTIYLSYTGIYLSPLGIYCHTPTIF